MTDTHFNEPIDEKKELHGTGRNGYDVPPEVQQKVIDIIIEEARKMGMNNRDLAYYIAIAKRESSFNPDAAAKGSTASGIAQVIDSTAATYGVTDANRFDARSSIKAGLGYFAYLKQRTIEDYGSAAGKYEVLIYYRYHYGENSTRWLEKKEGKPRPKSIWHVKDFSELEANKRYPDSKTVVDEADRIEAILNAAHGLVIQLSDVMGKPMNGRKAIAITKTPKPSGPPAQPAKPAAPPASAPPPTPAAEPAAPAAVAAPSAPAAASAPAEASAPAAEAAPAAAPENAPAASDAASPPAAADTPSPAGDAVEWELHAQEVTTDADGKLPEITTESQQAIMLLIPRVDYEAYNDAVSKEGMPEDGNQHVLKPHDEEEVAVAIPAPDNGWKPTPENTGGATPAESAAPAPTPTPTPAPTPAPIPAPTPTPAPVAPVKPASGAAPKTSRLPASTAAPANVFDAAAQAAKDKAAPKPSPTHDITFEDIVAAVKKDLGWHAVYTTSFAYVKQFYTRPKLPDAPLSSPTTAPGPARQQVIGSSLPNKEVKKPKVEEKVQTAPQAAVKPVAASGDAPWMPFAIQEQGKEGTEKVTENTASHRKDPQWNEQHNAREAAKKSEKAAQNQLRVEQKKKTPDTAKVAELQATVSSQQKAYADADAAMLKIEEKYNNPDIVKYLQSTNLNSDMARDDGTSWCSSFTNWCMEQAGYIGTDNALAASWKDWGEEISEPRYGAITVVTRSTKPEYHVGFYTGMVEKNFPDGEEEVEVKGKDGKVSKKTKKKYRKVKAVRLLSGNYSRMVKEDAGWTVDAADDPACHLVSYRWPTEKDKRK